VTSSQRGSRNRAYAAPAPPESPSKPSTHNQRRRLSAVGTGATWAAGALMGGQTRGEDRDGPKTWFLMMS